MKSHLLICVIFLTIVFTQLIAQETDYSWATVDTKIQGSNEKIKIVTKGGQKQLEWYNPKDMFVKIEIAKAKGQADAKGKITISKKKTILSTHGTLIPIKDLQKDYDLSPGYYAVNVVSNLLHKSDWIIFQIK